MKKTGRYHNDYSPRYTEAFDIYEKAKNHVKAQKRKKDYALFRLLNKNMATEAAMIIPYPTKLHKSGICLRNRKPRTVEKIICE